MEKLYLPLPNNADRLTYVRGLLAVHRVKSRKIARKLGVQESAVSRVLNGTMKSQRIQQAIADEIHMAFEDVWGKPTDALTLNRNGR